MLKVTLEQWRMFRAVVEYGGFNQAAQAIYKSQSSIHSAVGKIEQSLGVKLFTVEGRKTTLTESGQLMLRRADYLLEEAAKIEAVAHTLGEGIESNLRIAVDEIYPLPVLYKVLENTSAQFPLLNIELIESVLTGANELLENAQVDIAISPLPRNDGFSEQLCQFKFIAVAHPDHALHTMNRQLRLEDLKVHRQIVTRDSAVNKRRDAGWLGANQRFTVSHMRTSEDMVSKGLGFAWLPACAISDKLTQGILKPLDLESGGSRDVPLYLVFNDGDRLGPAARTFIGELRYQTMQVLDQEHSV